jgi:hypothetical protein
MSYVKINNKQYPLVKYLDGEQLEEIITMFKTNKMHYDHIPQGILIKTKYIGNFKTDERKLNPAQVYLCQSKKGYYLSLDHGYPSPKYYGKYDNGKNIFGKKVREEYYEGYKDLPGLEEYGKYYIAMGSKNPDESDISLWQFFFNESSL